jgi:NAD-dependent deacetylase
MDDAHMPTCPACQAILKPDIVLYEETLPMQVWAAAERHCNHCDVLLVVGTSLEVTPAANLPMTAQRAGARLIINNLLPTYMDDLADVMLRVDTADVLPAIIERMDSNARS